MILVNRVKLMVELREMERDLLYRSELADLTRREDVHLKRAAEAVAAARLEVETELGARAEK